MGVQGLWELLAPAGRRVSVETLAGKKLAIDASIWIIQFMKAMRDDRGEMVRNAHLLGFFRRICKLLFLRAKPVFVFDGGTPALKRHTVAARRRHRDNARAKIRKTAEKLLLNHLKSKRLEELADEIKRSKSGVEADVKGKQVASVADDRAMNQESLDELLAASIAAEEEGKLEGNVPLPSEDFNSDEEDGEDEDKEMIFPVNSGNVDPAVLASLPPSMQLDLLDQMRENLMAENRQKYQHFRKVPAKFSELQIQSYLKTVAFRREIDKVQKCASGRGVAGLQTSRIASEANREYIFSSSFTGDKQKLTPTGAEKNGGMVNQETRTETASDASKRKLFTSPSKPTIDMSSNKINNGITPDVETYLDERGRVRVSRFRGLGIHMSRDIQRNLDLMKEQEQMLVKKNSNKIHEPTCDNGASDFPKGHPQANDTPSLALVNDENIHCPSTSIASDGIYEEMSIDSRKSTVAPLKEAAIEISFSEDDSGSKTMVDNFFMNLVSKNTTEELLPESISLEKNMDDFESECIWEDGVVGDRSPSSKSKDDPKRQPSFVESIVCEEDEVVWEEDASFAPHSVESMETVSRGFLEEEVDLKEAIRRSLEDIKSKESSSAVPIRENTRTIVEDQNSLILVKNDLNICVPVQKVQLQSASTGLHEEDRSHKSDSHQSISSHNEHLTASTVLGCKFDGESTLKDDSNNVAIRSSVGLSHDIQLMEQDTNQSLGNNICDIASEVTAGESNSNKTDDHVLESCTKIDFEPTSSILDSGGSDTLNNSFAFHSNAPSESRACSSSGAILGVKLSTISLSKKVSACTDGMQVLVDNDTYNDPGEDSSIKYQSSSREEDKISASESYLDDEISLLKQERAYLGIEQRKLERNAESVSSEMFAECQELLQMFGLPYIIAPMEAEAQCAYMEMTNLVDGIVTDDSDVFLFGARSVFKNIFDDRKYVETYFMKDIENELGLSRDKLIRAALLLGSDYTEGVRYLDISGSVNPDISGIGIVNAIEVINAFPEKDGLLKFKNWVESPDPTILGIRGSQHGGNLGKKEFPESKEGFLGGDQSSDSTSPDTKEKEIFMDKHRNVSKNWHFPPSFPSESVITAYICPQVDESTEPFGWGKPDLPLLRQMCWEKFGWPIQKADELLVPVLKEYNKHETQLRMEAFYSFNERFAKIRSQRIKKAVKGIAGISSSELTDITDSGSSSKKRRGMTIRKNERSLLENDADQSTTAKRKSSKQSRKTVKGRSPPPHASAESSKEVGGGIKRRPVVNGRGRGKVKGGEPFDEESTESTSVDEDSTSEIQRSTMTMDSLPETRRSTRRRKQVNYAEDNAGVTELHVPDAAADSAPLEHIQSVTKSASFGNDSDSFDQAMPYDYLHIGGGFCLEENDVIPEKRSPVVTISTTHSPERNGGGFCVDESDPEAEKLLERLNVANHLPDSAGNSSKRHDETAVGGMHVLEDLGREPETDGGVAMIRLSAMPSLKRKRRKS
ncbi:DNA repair protein UVH3 [Platanthera zijinensis]|uniref:DNA repair protein UVH3 n=1 Tax=Platanthera zijinensis TaxID=2320716 RepID=A0AAP0FZQ5_9ASPA